MSFGAIKSLLAVFLVLVTAYSWPVNAQGTGSVRGTVRDGQGAPIAGARVSLRRADAELRATITNGGGEYAVDTVPAGQYTLRAKAVGRRQGEASVTVRAGAQVNADFSLPQDSSRLEAVTVAGIIEPPRSAWGGARLAYSFSDANAADNVQGSGQGLLEVLGHQTKHFGVYVMGNFASLTATPATTDAQGQQAEKLKQLQESARGISLSIVPHLFWGDATNNSLTVFIPFGYRVNALKDTLSTTRYFNQFVIGVGVAFTFWRGELSGLPVELSLGPSATFFESSIYNAVFRERKGSLKTFEARAIVPVGKGVGVLFEDTSPIGQGRSVFKAGLMLASGPTTR